MLQVYIHRNFHNSLEQIIYKCTQKSVDRRYNKMEDVIADLKHSLIDLLKGFVKLTSVDNDAKKDNYFR